jgi:hypothetical protein
LDESVGEPCPDCAVAVRDGVRFDMSLDITAQGFLTVGYKWTPTVSTAIGYRAIYTDYENGGFVYNITEKGPFMSIAFHF